MAKRTTAVFETVYNSDFSQWIVNDSLLRGWLYGSMEEEVGTEVMDCGTCAELWKALGTLYGARSLQGEGR